ncbi:MAG: hypothetical protein K8R92_04335 [Planctomycetes bacterium]|nr:hypothetical protein [Planctomycetota bacterium]
MRCVFAQCVWLGVAAAALALAPAAGPTIVANHLASSAPSGVQVFFASAPAQADAKATAQLCWGGERGLLSRTFRLTALNATDAAGKPVAISAQLGDANSAAWRDAGSEAAMIGDTTAYFVPLAVEPAGAEPTIAKIQGTLELKLGKTVIRVPPESRVKDQYAKSSLLEAKGLKLADLGEQQRFNLFFVYSNEKRGTIPNLFLVTGAGKPFYTSKPRVDGLGTIKISPTDSIPLDAKIRVGTGADKGNLIADAHKLLQSKEQLTAALAKHGLRVNEYACRMTNVYAVEVTRSPGAGAIPELVLDFAGKRIKGQGVAASSQQDPSANLTTAWTFDVPADLSGKQPDILVLLPGDDGVRAVPFEFHDPFGSTRKPAEPASSK